MYFLENLFFYSVRETEGSRFVVCFLHQLDFKGKLVILPPNSVFNSFHFLKMRSLDPIVVYVADKDEMTQLARLQEEFISFRVLLVLSRQEAFTEKDLLLLSPRLVFSLERGLESLGKVITTLFTV